MGEHELGIVATATNEAGATDTRRLTGAGRTREEQALAELGETFFSPGVAVSLTIAFVLTLLLVPAVQAWSALRSARWHALSAATTGEPGVIHAGFLPAVDPFKRIRQLVNLLPTAHQIRRFETTFQDQSVVGGFIRSRAQTLITPWFGVGTDRVYIGEDKWLFYRDGVDYITGPGFLAPHVLAQRRDMVDAVQQPDPRPAILRFRDQLASRGVALVLLPTPDKVMLYPDRLHKRAARWTSIPQNPSFKEFKEELERGGVHVFDPTTNLYSKRAQPLFLRADTHWTPAAVESVAHDFAQDLEARIQWHQARQRYQVRPRDVILPMFDLVNLLQFPAGYRFIDPATVRVRQVFDRSGALWQPTPTADVVMLGDSFCMIYENEQAGSPLSAGLPQQLSYELQRPLDRICQAGGGSYTSRLKFAYDLAAGSRRLTKVKVLIWQFAIRDLSVGDWRVIDLPNAQ